MKVDPFLIHINIQAISQGILLVKINFPLHLSIFPKSNIFLSDSSSKMPLVASDYVNARVAADPIYLPIKLISASIATSHPVSNAVKNHSTITAPSTTILAFIHPISKSCLNKHFPCALLSKVFKMTSLPTCSIQSQEQIYQPKHVKCGRMHSSTQLAEKSCLNY